MRSSTTRIAGGALLGMLLIMGALVSMTRLRVEHLGPVIIYGVAVLAVGVLLLAPVGQERRGPR